MSLPANGTPWPPHSTQTEALAEWSAWYSGDPTQLQTFYGPRTGAVSRPAQYAGGVVGTLARWWWGQPAAAGEANAKLHVPLAADICGTSADLLYSEPVNLSSESESVQAFLDELRTDGLDARLHEGAEVGAALGGRYMRTVWDDAVSPLPWTEVAHPDGAVPEFSRGRLRAVSLWTELAAQQDGVVHRLVERHESGAIFYALYAGTATNLGRAIPLQDHPDTAQFADVVNEDGYQETLTDRLTVSYTPNMLPNRQARNSPEGRSDLQGVTPMLDALDEAYSSWWRDIRHGKSRIHVPRQYLDSGGPGEAGVADLDRELYVPFDGFIGDPRAASMAIDAQQFDIRVSQHRETCQAWTERIIEGAGYSANSLAGDSGNAGAMTATEVQAKNRRSYMTRGKKVRYETQGLRDHLQTMVEIANAHLRAGISPDAIGVEFADGVQESMASLAQTTQLLRNAESASVKTRVAMLHPDWTDDQVTEEANAILAETGGGSVPDPDAGF